MTTEEIEDILVEGKKHSLQDLPSFPFESIEQLRVAKNKREIVFGAPQDFESIYKFGHPEDLKGYKLNLIIIVIVFLCIPAYAVFTGQWILLLGLVAYLLAVPLSRIEKFASIQGFFTFLFLVSLFFFDFKIKFLLGCFVIGIFLIQTLRSRNRDSIIKAGLLSETLFVHYYRDLGILKIFDREEKKFI